MECRARYTIEAALIMPLVLGLFTVAMRATIICYEEVKETAEKTATVQLDSPVKCMYRQEWVSGLLGIKDED
ncbi:MAG: hypothetical protein MRZ75_08370 [Roseburia sp.]|uniref:hypothetical protein n=1 Tax=Roseburia sp. 831b TaxID=1261635 RepID=UPI0009527D96|nr:hypothetical protein [Roseburia sp. 831b]MCI5919319.1 hypothetical protein [Roseburia sp.]MDD6216031.1 hypothetical protein [Roseburia sp.]MDY5883231.1 hypothetical protein [Roseburia sp.]WVK72505.1 hypothetical protein BIV16_12235 [Roseburia sp. 831b]